MSLLDWLNLPEDCFPESKNNLALQRQHFSLVLNIKNTVCIFPNRNIKNVFASRGEINFIWRK
jgi:hypothetical protein